MFKAVYAYYKNLGKHPKEENTAFHSDGRLSTQYILSFLSPDPQT